MMNRYGEINILSHNIHTYTTARTHRPQCFVSMHRFETGQSVGRRVYVRAHVFVRSEREDKKACVLMCAEEQGRQQEIVEWFKKYR